MIDWSDLLIFEDLMVLGPHPSIGPVGRVAENFAGGAELGSAGPAKFFMRRPAPQSL